MRVAANARKVGYARLLPVSKRPSSSLSLRVLIEIFPWNIFRLLVKGLDGRSLFNSIRRIKLNKLMMIERRDEKNIKNISFFLCFFLII